MLVIASTGSSFTAKIIGWVTGFSQTHFSLRYGGYRDQWLLHSMTGGVQPAWWSRFKKGFRNYIRWETNIDVAEEAADNLVLTLGDKEYDHKGLYFLGFIILLRKIGINIKKNPWGNPNKFMCTEIIIEWLKECKRLDPSLEINVIIDSEITDVEDITNILDSYPQYFKRI